MHPSLRRVVPKQRLGVRVLENEDGHDVLVANRAAVAHERERGHWDNPMGNTYEERLFGFISGSANVKVTETTWMPTKDCYERFVGIWAAMSVYGGLIGVAAFTYGMPADDADKRSTLFNASCATMLTASTLLMVSICQLTVMTVFLAATPEHKVRAVILENSTMMSVVGPMHLVGTLIFFIGIVLRILALDMRLSLCLMYMVPMCATFVFTWGWTCHALAVGSDWGLHKKAWEEAIHGEGVPEVGDRGHDPMPDSPNSA
jgi:hypothetical protein